MQFTIQRLLLVLASFAVPLALFSRLGTYGVLAATLAGFGIGSLCLILSVDQIWPAFRTALFIIGGMIAGLMFVPPTDPPYYPGCEFNYIVPGGLMGLILAIGKNQFGKTSSQTDSN